MRLGIAFFTGAEIAAGLNANVSKLQHRLNRTNAYAAQVTAKLRRMKEQAEADRRYINRVKTAAWAVLDAEDEDALMDACAALRRVLTGGKLFVDAAAVPLPATEEETP